jgi:hypothetical protein
VESQRAESGFALFLTAEEQDALLRVIRVVLKRIERPAAELVPAA